MRKKYADVKGAGRDPEQRALLDRITALSFAMEETRLYLDGHPYNRQALAYFSKTKNDLDAAMGEYAMTWGPLTGMDEGGDETRGWLWSRQPWPWELHYPESSDRPRLNPKAPMDVETKEAR